MTGRRAATAPTTEPARGPASPAGDRPTPDAEAPRTPDAAATEPDGAAGAGRETNGREKDGPEANGREANAARAAAVAPPARGKADEAATPGAPGEGPTEAPAAAAGPAAPEQPARAPADAGAGLDGATAPTATPRAEDGPDTGPDNDPDGPASAVIPDDAVLAREALPADFWDATPGEPPPQAGPPAPRPEAAAAARRPSPDSGAVSTPPHARSPRSAAGAVPDLERALLGPVADPALRETVDALQRLFPGRVLEVVASEDPAPDEPDPLPTEGERDAADEDDDPGGEH